MRMLATVLIPVSATFLAVIASEVAVRTAGFEPFEGLPGFDHIPVMTESDSVLGWRNRPGRYQYSVTNDGDNVISVSISESGRRAVESEPLPMDTWIFGCSFSFGWAVTDGEEYPARLDRLRGNGKVANFAVPGYGTAQAYRRYLQEVERTSGQVARHIVYGFASFHDVRNAATETWLRTLTRAGRSQAWIAVPRARIDTRGRVTVDPPQHYPLLPLSSSSSLLHLAQQQVAGFTLDGRESEMHELTLRVIETWKREVERAGSTFTVMALYLPRDRYFYSRGMAAAGVRVVDGSYNRMPAPGTLVRGDGGHPVASIHAEWAARLHDTLQNRATKETVPTWKIENGVLFRDQQELVASPELTGFVETVNYEHGELRVQGWSVDRVEPNNAIHLLIATDDENTEVLEVVRAQHPRSDVLNALQISGDDATPGFDVGISLIRLPESVKLKLYGVAGNRFVELPCTTAGCEPFFSKKS